CREHRTPARLAPAPFAGASHASPGPPAFRRSGGEWPQQERDVTLVQWTLVVPLKPLAQAKSRLSDTADDGLRPGLALAFAQDTVAAALACPPVRDVVVVTNDALA